AAQADDFGLAGERRGMSRRLDERTALLAQADERLESVRIRRLELHGLPQASERLVGLLLLELGSRRQHEDLAGDARSLGRALEAFGELLLELTGRGDDVAPALGCESVANDGRSNVEVLGLVPRCGRELAVGLAL